MSIVKTYDLNNRDIVCGGIAYTISSGETDFGYYDYSSSLTVGIILMYPGVMYSFFISIPNIDIPQGAVIQNAKMQVFGASLAAYFGVSPIRFEVCLANEDAPTSPTSYATFTAMPRTSSKEVELSLGESPWLGDIDFTSELQQVISRSGWESSNGITIFFDAIPDVEADFMLHLADDAEDYIFSIETTYVENGSSVPPAITITNTTKLRISDEDGMTQSIITFKADQNLTEWEARAGGTEQGLGILVGSGGSLLANTETTFDVTYEELIDEGDYRITVYGKNADGMWSTYE